MGEEHSPPDPSTPQHAGTEQARSELEEYLTVRRHRRRLFPRAAVVGMVAGIIASLFRALLAGGDALRHSILLWAHSVPAWGWLIPMIFTATCATTAVLLVRHYAPEASGSGIPHIEAVLRRFRDLRWERVLPIKLVGGVLAISSGLALGREGPTVQLGGSVGAAVASWWKLSTFDRLILTSAGAGAGLAAAFNAPLSGVVFVLEELQRDFRPAVFGSAFIAAAVADIVARLVSGQLPVFLIPSYPIQPLGAIPAFALLGLIMGLAGVIYNRTLLWTITQMARPRQRHTIMIVACVGAGVGLIAWFAPLAAGGGHELTELALAGQLALITLPLWFIVRFLLTMISYGTGAPGGIFAPLLSLGALLGLGVGYLADLIIPNQITNPAVFAVVGMAAYFTAIVRAPLTGIVLILEMTGNYQQMLPLLVSCFCAYATAEALSSLPIYEALLERDLQRQQPRVTLKEPLVIELEVQPGAPFDGRLVRDLRLPAGLILIRIVDGPAEWVPVASTRLQAHMRVTAVIAPEAIDGLTILREGFSSAEQ
ncbi:MAG: voltage gated Cl- channel protein [Herpetosiphonaceae bacterium]|nr:MAG: voltage gated Cl- channel protein [Herpetosiphonaceae bacterium]